MSDKEKLLELAGWHEDMAEDVWVLGSDKYNWHKEQADLLHRVAETMDNGTIIGWLRGTQYIGLPEHRQDGDIPVYAHQKESCLNVGTVGHIDHNKSAETIKEGWVSVQMTKEEAHDLCRAITGFNGGIVPNFDYVIETDRRLSYLYGRIQEAILKARPK